ncbi:MAG: sigma-70 family RNA polymerase sigma factor [Ahniella sp.]|nr:sigma-70 family RNA polymerase sigma factor [Ahniella sp.]
MVGKAGLLAADVGDIEQDIWLDLLSRLHTFDPERGHPRAFIRLVAQNKAKSILTARSAVKRGRGKLDLSLNWGPDDGDCEGQELHETIGRDDYLRRTRGPVRSEEERMDLGLDVRRFLARLHPVDRTVCLLLVERGATDVARVVGIPRSTLRGVIDRLRAAADEFGLDEYRQCARRFSRESGK